MTWLDLPFVEISTEEIYKKDVKLKKEDVDILADWVSKQPHLPQVTELQIVFFLHSCFYNLELTKRTIDVFFTARTLSPDLFGNRTIKDAALNTATKCAIALPLPRLTPEGHAVILGKLMDFNTANYDPTTQTKLFDVCTLLFLHKNGPTEGFQLIFDMSNFSFGHFLKMSPVVAKKFLYYLQEGMPIRLKYIHLINVVSFVDKILSLFKPFMKKELIDSIKIHTNIETLYDYVPKDILPAEYEGTTETSNILQEKLIKLMSGSEEFLKFQENQLIDKSKRPKLEEFEALSFGVSGSFKKLELD